VDDGALTKALAEISGGIAELRGEVRASNTLAAQSLTLATDAVQRVGRIESAIWSHPPTSGPTIAPGVLIAGLPSLAAPPATDAKPPITRRQDDLEAKVDRLLKAKGIPTGEVGAYGRAWALVLSPEGRKRLVALVTVIASLWAAAHVTTSRGPAPLPAVTSPAPSTLPVDAGSG
jgi:hypothetical protein